jgi:predicted RNase H-like HicB family nuclease
MGGSTSDLDSPQSKTANRKSAPVSWARCANSSGRFKRLVRERTMAIYPYTVEKDGRQYLIRFADVPEALTSARNEEEIPSQALDCLATALAGYALQGRPWPEPRKSRRKFPAVPTRRGLNVHVI